MIKIVEVKSKKQIKEFIEVPFHIYKNDQNWVPPLRRDELKKLMGINNPLFTQGEHALFIVYKDSKGVGRIIVGIEEKLNKSKNKREGYISLFECIECEQVFKLLLQTAEQWLKTRGMKTVVGPISPTKGDDSRGILVEGFDGPPVIMNSYNPKFYGEYFQTNRYNKYRDYLAYYIDTSSMPIERYKRVVKYAKKRYGYYVEKMNLDDVEGLANDLKKIVDLSLPQAEHRIPPSRKDLMAEIRSLRKYADRDLLHIAKSKEGEPIGFVVAVPNYNEILIKMKGRYFPFGILKYLYYKNKVKGVRVFIQHVIPKYRDKAVNGAIFYNMIIKSIEKGYTYGEGSTINEHNKKSILSVEKLGGRKYRVYRMYKKDL
ncbi:hypothetical protein PV797_00770 [Clostridiaceae bacterium M8S5]|nr:hypothetical protein PV797_00770 [Clostridiaceae bacterium M8S5]